MNHPKSKLRVLVVDDSPVDRMLLVHLFNSDARFQIVGTAASGAEAITLNAQLDPTIIVMDVTMADMDGLETTAQIMHTKPVPIVICTGLSPDDANVSFRSIEAGALALVGKPVGPLHPDHAAQVQTLRDTVANMAEVKVVRRWRRGKTPGAGSDRRPEIPPKVAASGRLGVVAIGASTGGPPALRTILSLLPPDFPLPILAVQHIAPGFLAGMAAWLQQTTQRTVRIAAQGERPLPGEVYLAPDHCHMGVDATGIIVLQSPGESSTHCPAVAHLFQSLAHPRLANRSVAVLLTGMGADGAEELLQLRQQGAITIAQDAESSVVHGMPGEAIRLGAALHIQPPEGIAALLTELARAQPAATATTDSP